MLEQILDNKLILSALMIAGILLLRLLLTLLFARISRWPKQDRRRRINTVHNICNLLIVIGLVGIWVSELREFALSIAAFSVAIVLALRELVQSLVGKLYQASMRSFQVGDWVMVGEQFGEVIDSDWLSTTLLEIDPHGLGSGYTGITLYIPNNVFFTKPVKNLNFMRRYIEHSFSITRENKGGNPFAAKAFLEERIREHSEAFHDVAVRYCQMIEHRTGVELVGTDPKVSFTTNELGHDVVTITMFCPREEAHEIEQRVTEDFYNFWYSGPQSVASDETGTH
ncbi:mechanosensitive ion channel protein MscS [Microbulbifer flavimaris]|uniref:Mechanosensitive ion channel protein MscS n=1 Tax=Microbulbifer flavimaris TaxID=1781068 RepID=A0ABX4I384_9GAMM|nr:MULTISPECIES: mechanosensitive ion channel domain-containing protein [Microbulbifer]KUJ84786.1 mechanosensitive ion channel protein MscS [Microbulbifer sp. ZGT114]PCO06882.1 mechanosensitive ion channel protein MscS [Microbulbifer flavimaris]